MALLGCTIHSIANTIVKATRFHKHFNSTYLVRYMKGMRTVGMSHFIEGTRSKQVSDMNGSIQFLLKWTQIGKAQATLSNGVL